jgi:hypothetical protein
MGKSTKPRLYISARTRIITIALAAVTVVGTAKLKEAIDDPSAGALTPERLTQLQAYNKEIANMGQKTTDAIFRSFPPGAKPVGGIRKATSADARWVIDVEQYQTTEGQCRIVFRLVRAGLHPMDIVSLKVNNVEVAPEGIPGSSRDVTAPCPVGKADARLTAKIGDVPGIVYVLPAF